MTTAIIGIGKIGGAVARHLVAGGESVVLAATDQSHVEALAGELGPLARAASVEGVADAGRIEVPGGDLFQLGLNGQLVDLDQARAMLGAVPA